MSRSQSPKALLSKSLSNAKGEMGKSTSTTPLASIRTCLRDLSLRITGRAYDFADFLNGRTWSVPDEVARGKTWKGYYIRPEHDSVQVPLGQADEGGSGISPRSPRTIIKLSWKARAVAVHEFTTQVLVHKEFQFWFKLFTSGRTDEYVFGNLIANVALPLRIMTVAEAKQDPKLRGLFRHFKHDVSVQPHIRGVRTSHLTAVVEERVPAIPEARRRQLIRKYLHHKIWSNVTHNPANMNLHLELQLGATWRTDPLDRSASHRIATFGHIRMEKGDTGVCMRAETMAFSLAILHWAVQLDGRGIKFLAADLMLNRRCAPYMHNFDECRWFPPDARGVRKSLIPAFLSNPAWPKPSVDGPFHRCWIIFRGMYLDASQYILNFNQAQLGGAFTEQLRLPCDFISGLERKCLNDVELPLLDLDMPSLPSGHGVSSGRGRGEEMSLAQKRKARHALVQEKWERKLSRNRKNEASSTGTKDGGSKYPVPGRTSS